MRGAVGQDLVYTVRVAAGAGAVTWLFAAHTDRAVRLAEGAGQDLEVMVRPTDRCGAVRVLANGQLLTGERGALGADERGPAPSLYRVRDLPAGPLVLEVEATSRTPLPSSVPYPWELVTKYARPPAEGRRRPHRAVWTACVDVEPLGSSS
jgi:hypothetical protein